MGQVISNVMQYVSDEGDILASATRLDNAGTWEFRATVSPGGQLRGRAKVSDPASASDKLGVVGNAIEQWIVRKNEADKEFQTLWAKEVK